MSDYFPALVVFALEIYLLFWWLQSRRRKDGRERMICFWGFLLGQLYLLWEVALVNQTGKPLPDTSEQKQLMGRLLLGGSIGGFFTIVGLFYVSFASFLGGKRNRR